MSNPKTYLGEFELMVLLAALRLGRDAYGLEIAREIERRTEREVSRGSLYVTFDRLEKKGLLASSLAHGSPDRGGRARRYLRVTDSGLRALQHTHGAITGLARGLEAQLEGGER